MYKPKIYSQLSEIPRRSYQGYIWNCQAKKPEVLNPARLYDFVQAPAFPYILEGLLYHRSDHEEITVMIRYTDRYHIQEYDLKNRPEEARLDPVEYIPHRLDGIDKVGISQLWIPEEDPLCCNMPVWRLKARLFTGFIPIKS